MPSLFRRDAAAACSSSDEDFERDPASCLSDMARYARTLKSEIHANCTTKEFTDFFITDTHFLALILSETRTVENHTPATRDETGRMRE